jgi:hypothetical protein
MKNTPHFLETLAVRKELELKKKCIKKQQKQKEAATNN